VQEGVRWQRVAELKGKVDGKKGAVAESGRGHPRRWPGMLAPGTPQTCVRHME